MKIKIKVLKCATYFSIASCQIIPLSTCTVCNSVGAIPVACFRINFKSFILVTFSPAAPKSKIKKKKKNCFINKIQNKKKKISYLKFLNRIFQLSFLWI